MTRGTNDIVPLIPSVGIILDNFPCPRVHAIIKWMTMMTKEVSILVSSIMIPFRERSSNDEDTDS